MAGLDVFLDDLERSRLLGAEEIGEVLDAYGPFLDNDARPFARRLVKIGLLTRYQANKLLNHRTWGFFLGEYRILDRLGAGGMGKVYLARHERTEATVAIKVLPPKRAAEDEQAVLRFRREVELSRMLSHPNLAHTIEIGTLGDAHYMVMDYIRGDSLYDLVKGEGMGSGTLDVVECARYFVEILRGLHAAHEAGLVHRDIKPSNLMVTPEGRGVILDLGLARAIADEGGLTQSNTIVGTVDYASPEQLADASSADRRSDLYSVGCSIHFAITGAPPFEGGDIVSKIFRHRMDDPRPLDRIRPEVPAAFAAIVVKAMAKLPKERHQDAEELSRDLQHWSGAGHGIDRGSRTIVPPSGSSVDGLGDPDDLSNPPFLPEGSSIRMIGGAEVTAAPPTEAPSPPLPAILLPEDSFDDADLGSQFGIIENGGGSGWLLKVVLALVAAALIAVTLIALLR